MVFYFKSTIVDPPAYVYVGKDKFESEWLSHFPLYLLHLISDQVVTPYRRGAHCPWLGGRRLVSDSTPKYKSTGNCANQDLKGMKLMVLTPL